jgi:phosphotransferase family enzyme
VLSPQETDIARYDVALPGLATVLDPDAFLVELRRTAPTADLRRAAIAYAKIKPREYCRATYRLDVAGAEIDADACACRREDVAYWLEELEDAHGSGPLGLGFIVLPDLAILVSVFPHDLDLRSLRSLADGVERQRLLRDLFPDRTDWAQAELSCLNYSPGRRCVARACAADGCQALLKAYNKKAYGRCKHNTGAFRSRGPLRVAQLLGASNHHRLLAFEWLPGHTLSELCKDEDPDWGTVSATGAALAALHAHPRDGLECWTRDAEIAYLSELSYDIGYICPQLARRAGDLARRLTTELEAVPTLHRPIHGDFSLKQVLVDGGTAALIDFDWARCGDPADDLGNMIAHVEHYELRGKFVRSEVERFRAALLEGYASESPLPPAERIVLYTAVGLFRKARFPFRARAHDWPQRTDVILARAEAIEAEL